MINVASPALSSGKLREGARAELVPAERDIAVSRTKIAAEREKTASAGQRKLVQKRRLMRRTPVIAR